MCLILWAWQAHPDYPLIVAANRDEFYARPTQASHIWTDSTLAADVQLLAGKDLQAGGTWMGITSTGRFAAVTNFREVPAADSSLSRGDLVLDYLHSTSTLDAFAEQLLPDIHQYAGFNLLLADLQSIQPEMLHISNRGTELSRIAPGIHGLSNAGLNSDWPKVRQGKSGLQQSINPTPRHAELQTILRDSQCAKPEELPATGVAPELELALSAIKIELPDYGTRSSTTLMVDRDNQIDWLETTNAAEGATEEHRFTSDGIRFQRL